MKRLGLLIPSSNVVLEPLAARQGNLQVHINRLGVLDVKLDDSSRAQFALDAHVAAATLLQDAKVDGIAWGGTSASWLGVEHDEAFVSRVQSETGLPATTSVLRINRRLRELGIRKLGMVTPYTQDVAERINRTYRDLGFHIGGWRHDGGEMSNDFAAIPPARIEAMIRDVAEQDVEAIVVMCTNVAASRIAADLSVDLGRPVIDSAAETLNLESDFWLPPGP